MAELDLVRLRELAAELGYWPASTDEEHVARLRAQDARYNEQEAQDPGGAKRLQMMGAWVTQVKKLSVQERKDRRLAEYGHLRAAVVERAEEDMEAIFGDDITGLEGEDRDDVTFESWLGADL